MIRNKQPIRRKNGLRRIVPQRFGGQSSFLGHQGGQIPGGAQDGIAVDAGQQAEFVAQRVLELHDEGVPFQEIAVLYRAHFHSMELQLEFTRRGIPFLIVSGLRFFEQRHIKDVVAYLRLIANDDDDPAFIRAVSTPRRGVGAATLERLAGIAAARSQPSAGPPQGRLAPPPGAASGASVGVVSSPLDDEHSAKILF